MIGITEIQSKNFISNPKTQWLKPQAIFKTRFEVKNVLFKYNRNHNKYGQRFQPLERNDNTAHIAICLHTIHPERPRG